MIAAMISKVIGLLYKSPLSNIIGSLGMGYTSLAQNASSRITRKMRSLHFRSLHRQFFCRAFWECSVDIFRRTEI